VTDQCPTPATVPLSMLWILFARHTKIAKNAPAWNTVTPVSVNLSDTNMARKMEINSAKTPPGHVTERSANVTLLLPKLMFQRHTCSPLTTIYSGQPFQTDGTQKTTVQEVRNYGKILRENRPAKVELLYENRNFVQEIERLIKIEILLR